MSLIILGQLVSGILVIILILIQERSAGGGGLFGGGGGEFYQRRRGAEKAIFISTIVTALIFTFLSILNLLY